MKSSEDAVDYRFGAYQLSSGRQVLYHDGRTLPVSTKLYYLLRALLEHQGEVVSKDDLIAAAWPGQVVTDAALAKQMLRVRRLIDDQDRDQPFIETHRGIGYRFSHPVETVAASGGPAGTPNASTPVRARLRMIVVTGLVVLSAALLAWALWGAGNPEDEVAQPGDPVTTPSPGVVGIALLPSSDINGWLSSGGVAYLSERLRQDPLIQTLLVPADAGLQGDSGHQAIEITTLAHIQYAATFGFQETPEGYLADVTLRSERATVSQARLERDSLDQLFIDADRWLRHELAVDTELSELEGRIAGAADAYALESYLQGLHELQGAHDTPTAAQYFQAAVNKDPDFLEAWVELAEVHVSLGDYERAIAISETLLLRDDVASRPVVSMALYRTIGLAQARLQNSQAATDALQRALAIVPEEVDTQARLDVLETLQINAAAQGQFEEAQRLGLERLALVREHFPLPNVMAGIHLDIAESLGQSHDYDALRDQVESALALYEATGNVDGMMRGFSMLNAMNFLTNQREAGLAVIGRARHYVARTSLVHEKGRYLAASAQILNLRGNLSLAREYAAELRNMSAETGNPMYLVIAEFTLAHQLYVQQRFEEAMAFSRNMLAQFEREDALRAALPRALVVAILVSVRAEPVTETEALLRRFDQAYPGQRDAFVNEFDRAMGHIAVRDGRLEEGLALLAQARERRLANGEITLAQYIGCEMLEILLAHPEQPWRDLMAQVERETDYDYFASRLKASFLAREGQYMDAVMVMRENRLKAADLWTARDQLLLEQWQALANGDGDPD